MNQNPTDIALECHNISKCYQLGEMSNIFTLTDYIGSYFRKNKKNTKSKDFWALKDVSFHLNKGQALGVIGRNGAGKSTLLKILSRITLPTTGQFGFNGSMASLLEVGMGFKQELTGKDNIFLSGSVMGLNRRQILDVYDEIVEFSEIEQFIDTPVKRYSSGMFVRLAFAVAAHLNPDILIIDEVLAVGDLKFQKKCLQKMNMAAKAGKTIMFVSHHLEPVSQLCESALYLEKGQVVQFGKTSDVIKKYQHDIMKDFSKEVKLEFEENPEQEAVIRSISVSSDKKDEVSNQFDILEPVKIAVDYELNRDYSDLKVIVYIFNLEGSLLWSSFSTDWHNYSEDEPVFITPKKKGTHQAQAEIPAPVLNTGQYEICISLGLNHDQLFDTKRGLFFNVTDNHNSYSHLMTSARSPGMIVTPFKWG